MPALSLRPKGRGPSQSRVEHLAKIIQKIKDRYPIEICVSAGLLDLEKAKILKKAGLDRLNHKLNTSDRFYSKISTTHTYEDRMATLEAARAAGIQLCSGVIAGMGEKHQDLVDVAYELRGKKATFLIDGSRFADTERVCKPRTR